jgi:hypothetical protein
MHLSDTFSYKKSDIFFTLFEIGALVGSRDGDHTVHQLIQQKVEK